MGCFIHRGAEAVANCKRCGKAMCEDCSAYSGHTGICPSCRKTEFEQERARLLSDREQRRKSVIRWGVFSVLLVAVTIAACVLAESAWLLVLLLIGIFPAVRIPRNVKAIGKIDERVAFLTGEIDKLDKALTAGVARI